MPPRHLVVAVGFLTRLPVPALATVDDEDLAAATAWFPLVGLLVGTIAGSARWLLDAPLGPFAASIVAVAIAIAVTGAFHEDGWADTFDGLWGGWTPQRRIEIMRDSRIGTYGACALLLALLLEATFLAALPSWRAGVVLALAHALGRACILLAIRLGPSASDQGSGARVAAPIGAVATLLALLVPVTLADAVLGLRSAWVLAASVATTAALVAIARSKVGGTTGDVLGAVVVASKLATLATCVALTRLAAW